MRHILLVEDERNFASFIRLELEHESYQVSVAYDGLQGLHLALHQDFDLILLDMMLPGMNGLEVCRSVRALKPTPILMITARDSVNDRVNGLDHGADDYLPKPFAIEELLARIRAIGRRMELLQAPASILRVRDLEVDLQAHRVTRKERVIELTKREYDLLVVFMENTNVVMTREMLLTKVWGYDTEVETNVVDVYVRYLRNKVDHPEEESMIQTIRGTGYVMRR